MEIANLLSRLPSITLRTVVWKQLEWWLNLGKIRKLENPIILTSLTSASLIFPPPKGNSRRHNQAISQMEAQWITITLHYIRTLPTIRYVDMCICSFRVWGASRNCIFRQNNFRSAIATDARISLHREKLTVKNATQLRQFLLQQFTIKFYWRIKLRHASVISRH